MTRSLRIFISTGEVSGDLQGSLLVAALQRQAAQQGLVLEILALGGDRMAQAGATLLSHTSSIGAIGVIDSLRYIFPTLKRQYQARRYLQAHPPDLAVLIDYVGPNLLMAGYLRRHFGIPVLYYIAPQEWVWSESSQATRRIIELTDEILAIFPQEAQYYAKHGARVTWVGHPFLDLITQSPSRSMARAALGIPAEQVAIALLPASRRQEMRDVLPVVLQAAQQIQKQVPQVHFWIPLALEQHRSLLLQAIRDYQLQATLTSDPALTLAAADGAIAKSGTVNLEAALLGVPQVVVYRVSALTAWVYRHLFKFQVPFVSPVNLLAQRQIVPELLQTAAAPTSIAQHLLALLEPTEQRQQMLVGYAEVHQCLGERGVLDRAAQAILRHLDPPDSH